MMPPYKTASSTERLFAHVLSEPRRYWASACVISLLVALGLFALLLRSDERERAAALSDACKQHAVDVLAKTLNGKVMGSLGFLGVSNLAPKQIAMGDLPADTPMMLEVLAYLGSYFQAEGCFLVDTNGIVASSWNLDGSSSTGMNVRHRPYFQISMQGKETIYAAQSQRSGQRALYLAAPIFEKNVVDSPVVGAAVIRLGLAEFDALLASWGQKAVLLTPGGVVFSSSNPDWALRLAGQATPERIRSLNESKQFGKLFETAEIRTLPFDPNARRAVIDGRRHALARASLDLHDPQGQWTLVVLQDTDDLFWAPARIVAAVFAGAVSMLLFFVGHLALRNAFVKRQAAFALKQSQAEMTQIFNTAAGGMRVLDRDFNVVKVNDAFVRLTGQSRENVVGTKCFESFGGMECDSEECTLRRILAGESLVEGTVIKRDGEGMPIYCDVVCTPLYDSGGELVGAIEDFRDMTERMTAQHAIAQSEEKYRELVECASSVIIKLDMEGNITFFNEYAQLYFGYSEDEILGKPMLGTILPEIESSSRDLGHMLAELLKNPAQYETNENENQCKDGRRVWVSWTNKVILDDVFGEPKGLLCIGLDATERKLAQDRLHEAMEIISGASRIQRAILPAVEYFGELLPKHFVLWEPRDIVGGDMYWIRPWGNGVLLILADCTGHGVPGAFITLIASGALDRAMHEVPPGDPAALIARMNVYVKLVLGQDFRLGQAEGSDDGLEPGVCYIAPGMDHLVFAGGHFQLFTVKDGQVDIIKGDRLGIGYRHIPMDATFRNHEVPVAPGQRFYLCTDGIIDQVGGSPRRSFGKKRFTELLLSIQHEDIREHGDLVYAALKAFQGHETRRDDVSLVGFELHPLLQHSTGRDKMAFVEWKDALNTGYDEVDDQHKYLVNMLNELYETVNGDRTKADLAEIVNKLKEYAIMHFTTEEKHMKRTKYPDMFKHMTEHASFITKVKDFSAKSQEEIDMLPAVMDFLKKWLVEHISSEDVKMGRYLKQHA